MLVGADDWDYILCYMYLWYQCARFTLRSHCIHDPAWSCFSDSLCMLDPVWSCVIDHLILLDPACVLDSLCMVDPACVMGCLWSIAVTTFTCMIFYVRCCHTTLIERLMRWKHDMAETIMAYMPEACAWAWHGNMSILRGNMTWRVMYGRVESIMMPIVMILHASLTVWEIWMVILPNKFKVASQSA
jgi:hypothetical protein